MQRATAILQAFLKVDSTRDGIRAVSYFLINNKRNDIRLQPLWSWGFVISGCLDPNIFFKLVKMQTKEHVEEISSEQSLAVGLCKCCGGKEVPPYCPVSLPSTLARTPRFYVSPSETATKCLSNKTNTLFDVTYRAYWGEPKVKG